MVAQSRQHTKNPQTWLNSICPGRKTPSEIGPRNAEELLSLAAAIDALLNGSLESLGDILMQRFKGVQLAIEKGDWSMANKLQPVADGSVNLVSTEEMAAVTRDLKDVNRALGYGTSASRSPARG